jgi:5-amino-6-(5-phosphoribosylamino)uracil reductase
LSDETLRAQRVERGQAAYPTRIIVSNSGLIDPAWKVFKTTTSPILIFTSDRMPEDRRRALMPLATLHFHPQAVDIAAMLKTLRRQYKVQTIVCEGGAQLFRALCEIGAVDELYLTWCPLLLGGATAPTLTGPPGEYLPRALKWRLLEMEPNEAGECFLHYERA